jgi:hypothetical protein
MKVDLCVALNGPNVDVMLPFWMHTLSQHTDLSKLHIHLVHKNCAEPVVEWLNSIRREGVSIYGLQQTFKEADALHFDPFDQAAFDCSGTVLWMAKNCGASEWCFISHFDIVWHRDLVGRYIDSIADGVGQIGEHSHGLVCYRRSAIKQCSVGFNNFSGFCVVKDHRGDWKLRHDLDPRRTDQFIRISGWDVGELMELNLQGKGWRVLVDTDVALNSWRTHIGTGSGHCGDVAQQRQNAITILNRFGLKPIT